MDLEQQLRTALAASRPGPQVRSAVMARLAGQPGRRGTNRWVLVGAVVALGAAAAMLAMRLPEPLAPAFSVDADSGPDASSTATGGATVPLDPVATAAAPVTQGTEPQSVAPGIDPFTVQLLPLQGDVADPPHKAAIEAVYVAFMNGLRVIPGVILVEPATADSATPVSPQYRLTLTGEVFPASGAVTGDFRVKMEANRSGPEGRSSGTFMTGITGELVPTCTSPPSMDVLANDSCADPVGVATRLLAALRKMVFPPDPQLQRRLQARLVDQGLDPGERLRALVDLASFGRASGPIARGTLAPGLRDAAVVRAAIELASATTDPAARAQVWYYLRGSPDPELVRPLMSALRADADDDARVQALTTLAAGFAADPRVRSALETAAAGDSNPLVRALAQRELGDAAGWTKYVLDSLKDASRSPVGRVEALFHAYGLPTSRTYGTFSADGRILRTLDDAAVRALTEALPRAAADSPRYASASLTLLSELAYMKNPAITDMLLDGVGAAHPWSDRSFTVRALSQRTDDSRVRAFLQNVASEDVDPQVRALAGNALRGSTPVGTGPADATIAAAAMPPRLGVMTDYVQPGPDVPAELVGKLAVVRMGFGTVAEQAGMKEADVLLSINGKAISSGPQLIEVLDALPRGVDIEVLVSRSGQTERLTARF